MDFDTLDSACQIAHRALEFPEDWDSLVINRRKPYTYRAFYQSGNYRICLHRFETCDEAEAFLHPHPWPGAFRILQGGYKMGVGRSKDRESSPSKVAEFVMNKGSAYLIDDPLTWHAITPIGECYTIMVNGAPWARDYAHNQVRTTKGKDLERMTPEQLQAHFDTFKPLLEEAISFPLSR